jgi:hypothetical protein
MGHLMGVIAGHFKWGDTPEGRSNNINTQTEGKLQQRQQSQTEEGKSRASLPDINLANTFTLAPNYNAEVFVVFEPNPDDHFGALLTDEEVTLKLC